LIANRIIQHVRHNEMDHSSEPFWNALARWWGIGILICICIWIGIWFAWEPGFFVQGKGKSVFSSAKKVCGSLLKRRSSYCQRKNKHFNREQSCIMWIFCSYSGHMSYAQFSTRLIAFIHHNINYLELHAFFK
jgi:hypothetical protein